MSAQLRPYQSNDVDRLSLLIMAHPATLYALPTGGGKTVMLAELARRFERIGLRILIVVHRRGLVRQTVEKLARIGIVCGVIASDFASDPSSLSDLTPSDIRGRIATSIRRHRRMPP